VSGKQLVPETLAKSRGKVHSKWRIVGIVALILIGLVACARPFLPQVVRWYVNQTLSHNLLYEGRVGAVTLNLWRGAYSISDIRLFKKTGDVPDPLFSCKTLELAVQWNAIIHGKMVAQVAIDQPEINFVAPSDDADEQTGAGAPWLQTLQHLFPFQINSAQINDGSIHFKSYVRAKPVDVYLDHIQASVNDLTNVENESTPLLATVSAKGMAMDQAPFEFHMKLNPFSYRPSFNMAVRLLGLDVTKLNDLALTYGQFQFKQGFFDLVVEVQSREGQMTGYAKPLFRNLVVFDLLEDLKTDTDPLQFFWQALIGATTGILTNPPRDQFGTSIPFTGDLDEPDTDYLAAIGNVLRNAFIRAYLPRLDSDSDELDGMQFEAPSITGPTTVDEEQ
jgi:hypothetical protein